MKAAQRVTVGYVILILMLTVLMIVQLFAFRRLQARERPPHFLALLVGAVIVGVLGFLPRAIKLGFLRRPMPTRKLAA